MSSLGRVFINLHEKGTIGAVHMHYLMSNSRLWSETVRQLRAVHGRKQYSHSVWAVVPFLEFTAHLNLHSNNFKFEKHHHTSALLDKTPQRSQTRMATQGAPITTYVSLHSDTYVGRMAS